MSDFFLRIVHLSNHVISEEGLEGRRDADTFRRLVILEERCYDARESECRAVKGMAELHFLVLRTAVTALEAVRLIGVEIRG